MALSCALAIGCEVDATTGASQDAGFDDRTRAHMPDGSPDAGGAPDTGAIAVDGGLPDAQGIDGGAGDPTPPYAQNVVAFEPGPGALFGHDNLPDVVLGPPQPLGAGGALDVVSLGPNGFIVLDFGNQAILNGPGADFIVFENAFRIDGGGVFAELGEVSVSVDGQTWATFSCDTDGTGDGQFPGCAGWTPTEMYDPDTVIPLDPALTGGDAFDLEELGLEAVRFVRVRDLAGGAGPAAGFDLDAIGAIHLGPLDP